LRSFKPEINLVRRDPMARRVQFLRTHIDTDEMKMGLLSVKQ
jgi:hypothetical protein